MRVATDDFSQFHFKISNINISVLLAEVSYFIIFDSYVNNRLVNIYSSCVKLNTVYINNLSAVQLYH